MAAPRNVPRVTGGANAAMDRAGETDTVALSYDGQDVRAIAANDEIDRICEEDCRRTCRS